MTVKWICSQYIFPCRGNEMFVKNHFDFKRIILMKNLLSNLIMWGLGLIHICCWLLFVIENTRVSVCYAWKYNCRFYDLSFLKYFMLGLCVLPDLRHFDKFWNSYGIKNEFVWKKIWMYLESYQKSPREFICH